MSLLVLFEDSALNKFSLRKAFRRGLLTLFLAPCSVASEDSATNEFFIREVCKKSGVSFILFLAPYSVASEDSATNEFFIREAHKNSGLTCQFCHVW